jgi:hypothetical protein
MSASYLLYLIEETLTRRLSIPADPEDVSSPFHRSLSITDTAISISTNNTITVHDLHTYVPGISDQRLYVLTPGIE